MDILSLTIAVLALIIASAAYYRSGGNNRIRGLERALNEKIERLSAKTLRAADSPTASVKPGYQRNVRMISDLQSRVAALREDAIEEIREDLKTIAQRLDRLAERAARELKDLKAGLDFTLMEAEVELRLTVDEAKAHLKVIEAKRDLLRARLAIFRNDLIEAETRLESALRNIEEAQSLAVGHQESLATLQKQTQEMLVAVRAKAGTVKASSIDVLIERSNRLLTEMSGQPSEERLQREKVAVVLDYGAD